MLTQDVEDGSGEVGVLAVLDELAQDAQAHIFAVGQMLDYVEDGVDDGALEVVAAFVAQNGLQVRYEYAVLGGVPERVMRLDVGCRVRGGVVHLKHSERMASTTTILWSSAMSDRNVCICFIRRSTLFSAPVFRSVVIASVAIARLESVRRPSRSKLHVATAEAFTDAMRDSRRSAP